MYHIRSRAEEVSVFSGSNCVVSWIKGNDIPCCSSDLLGTVSFQDVERATDAKKIVTFFFWL